MDSATMVTKPATTKSQSATIKPAATKSDTT